MKSRWQTFLIACPMLIAFPTAAPCAELISNGNRSGQVMEITPQYHPDAVRNSQEPPQTAPADSEADQVAADLSITQVSPDPTSTQSSDPAKDFALYYGETMPSSLQLPAAELDTAAGVAQQPVSQLSVVDDYMNQQSDIPVIISGFPMIVVTPTAMPFYYHSYGSSPSAPSYNYRSTYISTSPSTPSTSISIGTGAAFGSTYRPAPFPSTYTPSLGSPSRFSTGYFSLPRYGGGFGGRVGGGFGGRIGGGHHH